MGENVEVWIVYGTLNVEEVENAVEYMILSSLYRWVDFQSRVGSPNDKWDLGLNLWSHRHRHSMHVEVTFSKRLPMVGDENHAASPVRDIFERVYHIMQKVVSIEDRVVVGVDELLRICF